MGGNIFKDIAKPIAKENIKHTIDAYKDFLKAVFPMKGDSFDCFEAVGSAGKKAMSGDLDLAIDWTHIVRHFTKDEIEKWGVDYNRWETRYKKISKRARSATPFMCKMKALLQEISETLISSGMKVGGVMTAGNIFTCFPQHDANGITDDYVQIDWMVGDIDWLRWSYYSHGEPNLKGLHRTQFIVACLANKGYTFNHFSGIKKKSTKEWTISQPSEAVSLLSSLYGQLNIDQTYRFKDLHLWLFENTTPFEYREVIMRYRGILVLARAAVPEDIITQT